MIGYPDFTLKILGFSDRPQADPPKENKENTETSWRQDGHACQGNNHVKH